MLFDSIIRRADRPAMQRLLAREESLLRGRDIIVEQRLPFARRVIVTARDADNAAAIIGTTVPAPPPFRADLRIVPSARGANVHLRVTLPPAYLAGAYALAVTAGTFALFDEASRALIAWAAPVALAALFGAMNVVASRVATRIAEQLRREHD